MRSTVLILVIWVWSGSSAESVPAHKEKMPGVAEWIAKLGSRSHVERELAMTELKKIGKKAIPELQKALKHREPEIRARSQALINFLQKVDRLAPTRVTLRAKNLTIGTLFDDISNQTGYKVDFYDNGQPMRVSIHLKDVPFWEAMEAIASKSGLVLQSGWGDRRIHFSQQSQSCPFTHVNGAFRITANSISHYRTVNLAYVDPAVGASRNENLTLSFHVHSEPKLRILGYEEAKLTAAYDNLGTSMLPPKEDAPEDPGMGFRHRSSMYGNGYHSGTVSMSVKLHRNEEKAKTLKVIRGYVPLTLLVADKKVTVVDKVTEAKDKKVKVGDTEFHIESVKEMPNRQIQVKMTLTNPTITDQNDYSWVQSLYQRLELVDAKGNKYSDFGSSTTNSTSSRVEMIRTFGTSNESIGKPDKLVYHLWDIMHHHVRFELKNVPLP